MQEGGKNKEKKKFKFKELRVYSSTEWLADNKKKYRQVFDRNGTTYVYAELSFYNKLFDAEVWEVNVVLKCYMLKSRKKEICSLVFKRKVSKYDNVVFIREGWGNKKEGAFWKKGTYFWEAYIEDEKVASKYFYVEEAQEKDELGNGNFVSINSVKLYEGQYDDVDINDRKFLKSFSAAETRYVYADIILNNLNGSWPWHCELFVKFYNEAKELKGQVIRLNNIKKADESIRVTAGWGSNVKGSWRQGKYTVEIVFMDRLLGVVPFKVLEEIEEGVPVLRLPHENKTLQQENEQDRLETFDEVLFKLDRLIGLQEIKKQVRDHANYIQFLKLRREKGFKEEDQINIHSVFSGNPGTGKTTVAKMMGSLYKKMGLLSKGHVLEVDRVDLVGEYIGQTAPKVKEVIEKARGGVLFIDEAYSLARANDDSKDFGREVIEILVKEMSNGPGDMAVIVAGYPKEIKYFIESNPGLKSRFRHFFDFSDYMPDELIGIMHLALHEKEVTLDEDASDAMNLMIRKAFRNRDVAFGNARYIHELVEKAKINLGLRVMKNKSPKQLSKGSLSEINYADVLAIEKTTEKRLPNLPVDEGLLKESLQELDNLIGIDNVKKEIKELVEIVRFNRNLDKHVLQKFYLHTVFVGNPGTGKTTVARILTTIYKALGILERGHMVETDRQGLVAGFVGQTAIKTAERIDEAMGGVLFIDEAYALSNFNGLQGDFGNEAIQTILKRMEDHRGEFFIFVAGYPDNMDVFLKANPGLRSRFDRILKFDDYKPGQLLDIGLKMFADNGYKPMAATKKLLKNHFEELYRTKDKFFGNARAVRTIVDEVIKNQNLRLAEAGITDKRELKKIREEDIEALQSAKSDNDIFTKNNIGFKSS